MKFLKYNIMEKMIQEKFLSTCLHLQHNWIYDTRNNSKYIFTFINETIQNLRIQGVGLEIRYKGCPFGHQFAHHLKKSLSCCPFLGILMGSPSKWLRWKELGPAISLIKYGPNHKLSNFPCFPSFSLPLSHSKTVSPIMKSLCLADMSKTFFTLLWFLQFW